MSTPHLHRGTADLPGAGVSRLPARREPVSGLSTKNQKFQTFRSFPKRLPGCSLRLPYASRAVPPGSSGGLNSTPALLISTRATPISAR